MRGTATQQVAIGEVFGRWTVQGFPLEGKSKCRVICQCGTEQIVYIPFLIHGKSKSCGCLRREMHVARYQGHKKRPEYAVWSTMKARCSNPRTKCFGRYGGRGIGVCNRWIKGEEGKTGFECFMEDMGDRPSSHHSIERKDNNGHYEPGNCVWATHEVQVRNMRNNHFIEYQGEQMILADAIRLSGLDPKMVATRLSRGWSTEKAISTPAEEYDKQRCIIVEMNGVKMNLKQAAKAAGVKYHTVYARIKKGWPIPVALGL